MAKFCTHTGADHACRTCAVFAVTKIMAFFSNCVHIGLDFCGGESPQATGRSVGPYAVGLYQPTGWLVAPARWVAKSSCIGPRPNGPQQLVINNMKAALVLRTLHEAKMCIEMIEHLLFTMNGRQKNETNRTIYNLTTT